MQGGGGQQDATQSASGDGGMQRQHLDGCAPCHTQTHTHLARILHRVQGVAGGAAPPRVREVHAAAQVQQAPGLGARRRLEATPQRQRLGGGTARTLTHAGGGGSFG